MRRSRLLQSLLVAALACAPLLAVAADPTFCTEYETVTAQCNCRTCQCQTCHTCGCHVNKAPWTSCTYGNCGRHGCWCSPMCSNCCYDADCEAPCHCQTCCDTCSSTRCKDGHNVAYSVHSVVPSAVPAFVATEVRVLGGFFVATQGLLCRIGDTTMPARYVSSNEVRCTAPNVGAGNVGNREVAVSLDAGAHWTVNNPSLRFYACPGTGGNCTVNGVCDSAGVCVCNDGFVGADCGTKCPIGTGGAVCSGQGSCSSSTGSCTCAEGRWGAACENACAAGIGGAACSGSSRGLCSQATGECTCLTGYTGTACEHEGTCEQHGLNCTCTEPGYWGPGCANTCPGASGCTPGSGCSTVCSGHGVCSAQGACLCEAGYAGAACASECNGGASNPCGGAARGVCNSDGSCTCTHGYFGPACASVCPGGAATPCSGHGRCNDDVGSCACDKGFMGADCSVECPHNGAGQVCWGRGRCVVYGGDDGQSHATCQCQPAFYGNDCSNICPGATGPVACSGHGTCTDEGACSCDVGYFGIDCSNTCPGSDGAGTVCSGHGYCGTNGACRCEPSWWGTDCAGQCKKGEAGTQGAGQVCSGHGACLVATGTCECSTPWSGDACDTATCMHDCYGHGRCQLNGTCTCNDAWTGMYCETFVPPSSRVDTAAIRFKPEDYRVAEDVGTLRLNVTRSGTAQGAITARYATREVAGSARSGVDFQAASGTLSWPDGDGRPRNIEVRIIEDDVAEGVELFEVVLFGITGPGYAGGANATVVIDAGSPPKEGVELTVRMLASATRMQPGTPEGAAFAAAFAKDVCRAEALNCDADRIIIVSVTSTSAGAVLTFAIVEAKDKSKPGADKSAKELGDAFVALVGDRSSALYDAGTETSHLDMSFAPQELLPSGQAPVTPPAGPVAPEETSYAWIAGVVIPIALLGTCAAVGYKKRKPITDWLLWKLANFRFVQLREDTVGGVEDEIDDDNRL